MNYLYSLLLGLLQAAGEFLPVAGSSCLLTVKRLLPLEGLIQDPNLDAALRWGALLALILVFRKSLWATVCGGASMVKGIFSGTFKWRKAGKYQIMAVYLAVATLPMLILAFIQNYYNVLGRWAESFIFSAAMLFISAGILYIGSHSLCRNWTVKEMRPAHALKAGLFQAAACLPGLSRTGTVFCMLRNMGFQMEAAFEFSFLMTVPTLLGTNLMRLGTLSAPADWGVLLIGFGAAFLAGVGVLCLVKALVKKDRYGLLAFYCLAAGICAVVLNFI